MRTLIARMNAPAAGALGGVLVAVMLMGLTARAGAQVMASDETAGYVVFPKIIVEESGPGLVGVDTLVQLTNTNTTDPIRVNCWYVNANSHCGDQFGPICESNAECGGATVHPRLGAGGFLPGIDPPAAAGLVGQRRAVGVRRAVLHVFRHFLYPTVGRRGSASTDALSR